MNSTQKKGIESEKDGKEKEMEKRRRKGKEDGAALLATWRDGMPVDRDCDCASAAFFQDFY